MKIDFETVESFKQIIENNNHHLLNLLEIVKSTGEEFEGNCFYYHKSFNEIADINKKINLYSLAKNKDSILEIGFNAGHSSLLFLLANPNSVLYCFDICDHSYTEKCFQYLSDQFPNRIKLFKGDSRTEINNFKPTSSVIFDLIHIDGSHEMLDANLDFFNTLEIAKKGGILIFDDTYIPGLKMLWDGYIRDGYISEINVLPVATYPHSVACYLK